MTEEKLSQEEKEKLVAEQKEKEQQEVKRVIRGVNDTFQKHYKFSDYDLEFDLRLKFPSLIEQAAVAGDVEKQFGGMSMFANKNFYQALHMLAIMQYQLQEYENGKEIQIPEMFVDAKEVYNPFILGQIYKDFTEWMDGFQY